jgi:hypothetical protein
MSKLMSPAARIYQEAFSKAANEAAARAELAGVEPVGLEKAKGTISAYLTELLAGDSEMGISYHAVLSDVNVSVADTKVPDLLMDIEPRRAEGVGKFSR